MKNLILIALVALTVIGSIGAAAWLRETDYSMGAP